MLITYQTWHVQKVFLIFTAVFPIYCFSCGKRKCVYVFLGCEVFFTSGCPLSPYVCVCIPYVCVCTHVGRLYCKCPTWKWAFLGSMHKALAPCLSCACAYKQNGGTSYMIFTFSVVWMSQNSFTLQILPLSVLLSGLFCLLVLLCMSGGVWFLHFFPAFIFLWLLIKREHPSWMALLCQPFPPFY